MTRFFEDCATTVSRWLVWLSDVVMEYPWMIPAAIGIVLLVVAMWMVKGKAMR